MGRMTTYILKTSLVRVRQAKTIEKAKITVCLRRP